MSNEYIIETRGLGFTYGDSEDSLITQTPPALSDVDL